MNHLNLNNVANPSEVRIEKSIGALSIGFSKISGLKDATVSLNVDGNNSSFSQLATEYPLLPFVALATIGQPTVTYHDDDQLFYAYIPLAKNGNLSILDKESLNIKFKNLDVQTIGDSKFTVDSIEYPINSPSAITYDRKAIPAGINERTIDVQGASFMCLDNVEAIEQFILTFLNGKSIKYSVKEMQAIERDFDPIKVINDSGTIDTHYDDLLIIQTIGVSSVQFFKGSEVVNVYTRS